MLTYLPESMDTVKGQNILMDKFHKGAFSFIVVEGMEDKEVKQLTQEIEQIDHVDTALWYSTVADISIPKEMLPDKVYDAFNSGDSTLIAVFFDYRRWTTTVKRSTTAVTGPLNPSSLPLKKR